VTDAGQTTADLQVANLSSNEPELVYTANRDLAHRKTHGQFFTPYSIACFMCQWITEVSISKPTVLDPCAGLGVFERAVCETDPKFAQRAVFKLWEKDERLAIDLAGICDRLGIRKSIANKDFINEHGWSETYDAVIANPPYYKHHFVKNKEGIRGAISSGAGASFSVQTNIYCWFLIKALSLLRDGGRLAFIIPTEFMNANYGTDVKKFLLETGCLRHIISFCYKTRTFDDAITTACVLLAEKGDKPPGRIRFYRAGSSDQLDNLNNYFNNHKALEYRSSELDAGRKWRCYFPGGQKIRYNGSKVLPFSTYGRFSRGIATGANHFFAIPPSSAAKLDLPDECLIPCVSKARHASGKTFTRNDFAVLKQADKPVLLFNGQAATGAAIENYIQSGESSGFHERYLTRTRRPWYAVEQRSPSKIWVGVFSRSGFRFVWNESECITLTCFHVFQPSDTGASYLPFLYLYLNSAIGRRFLELEKREYGDGLEKLEPNDINRALAPDFSLLDQADQKRLSELQEKFIITEENTREEISILEAADSIFGAII